MTSPIPHAHLQALLNPTPADAARRAHERTQAFARFTGVLATEAIRSGGFTNGRVEPVDAATLVTPGRRSVR